MKQRVCHILAAVLIATFFSSCASGPDYAGVKASGALTPHAGKGMVVVYRSRGIAGSATKPYVFINQTQMPERLARGGFYSYEAAPGPLRLAHSFAEGESTGGTKTKAVIGGLLTAGIVGAALAVPMDIEAHRQVAITVQVEPGRTHYLYLDRFDRPLVEVPREEVESAEEELADCCWLNPKP